jgi:transcriptional antiterminator NusG
MTGKEDKLKGRLEYRLRDKNLRVVVPKRRLRERKNGVWEHKLRTLFPGYVLLNGYLGPDEYYLLKDIPDLIRVLKDNCEPYIIDQSEIMIIGRLISDNGIIESSRIKLDGGKVVVIDGPLLGMEGLIEKLDKRKGRAKLRINFMSESRLIELAVSMIQPL